MIFATKILIIILG